MPTTVVDEKYLVQAYKGGDRSAFDQIVRAYRPGLYAAAVRRLGDPKAAEDAVQETFLRAYRALPRFNGQYHLRAWLYRILANVCFDEGGRRARESALVDRAAIVAEREQAAPDHALEIDPIADKKLSDALSSIPASYREALELRYGHDLSFREVAEVTGISEENARARVHRGRTALRRVLQGAVASVLLLFPFLRKGERAALADSLGGGGSELQGASGAGAAGAGAAQALGSAAPAASGVASKASSLVPAASASLDAAAAQFAPFAPVMTRVAVEAAPVLTGKAGVVAAAVGALSTVAVPVAATQVADRVETPAPVVTEVALDEPASTTVPTSAGGTLVVPLPVSSSVPPAPVTTVVPTTAAPTTAETTPPTTADPRVAGAEAGTEGKGFVEVPVPDVTPTTGDTTATTVPASVPSTTVPTTVPETTAPTTVPPTPLAGGQVAGAGLASLPAGPRVALSGPVSLRIDGTPTAAELDGKVSVPDVPADAPDGTEVTTRVEAVLTLLTNGGQVDLRVVGTALVTVAAGTRTVRFDGASFRAPGGEALGLVEAGTASGTVGLGPDGSGTLSLTLAA